MTLRNAFDALATETTLAAVLAELQAKLDEGGTVALAPATLAALESVTATLAGPVDLSATTLAALEAIQATITGEVDLSPATLAALETITVTVSGAVATNALTDAQLRAAPVVVDTGLTFTPGLTDAELRASAVPVATGLAQPLTDTQLRAAAVSVETELSAGGPLALEATLDAVRTRLPAALVGGALPVVQAVDSSAYAGFVSLGQVRKISEGKGWIVSARIANGPLSGAPPWFQLGNPPLFGGVANLKHLRILSLTIVSSAPITLAAYITGGSVNMPNSTALVPQNFMIDATARTSVVEARQSLTAQTLTGLPVLSHLRVGADEPFQADLPGPLTLAPNKAIWLGTNTFLPASQEIIVTCAWYEDV